VSDIAVASIDSSFALGERQQSTVLLMLRAQAIACPEPPLLVGSLGRQKRGLLAAKNRASRLPACRRMKLFADTFLFSYDVRENNKLPGTQSSHGGIAQLLRQVFLCVSENGSVSWREDVGR
jgi:hypothetical protein